MRTDLCLLVGRLIIVWVAAHSAALAQDRELDTAVASDVLDGLKAFYQKTGRSDGSFQPGIDPEYQGMSDSAYSDIAPVTYACTIHKTFGWQLPHEEQTKEFLLARQKPSGEFVNELGTVDPSSPQGRTYNTTQALVALHALGVKPRYDPLPVFEQILQQDYKALPPFSTSFFPLAYLCSGQPIPDKADRDIRALMIQDEDGYLDNHIAATFHASHYYCLVGEPTPRSSRVIERILRDQKPDGSWMLNMPSRDRHATFDAVFTLLHEGPDRADCREAIRRAGRWALTCRNSDGGFGHFPGSPSDADAMYFHVGTLVMADFLEPVDPLPADPHLLSWGHLMPVVHRPAAVQRRLELPGWVGGVAINADASLVATASSDGIARIFSIESGVEQQKFSGHDDYVAAVAFSSDGRVLATGSFDHSARIWDVRSGACLHTLHGHRGAIMSVAFAPQSDLLATASIDASIRLWNALDGTLVRTLSDHKSWVNALAFSPDGATLVSGSSDGTLKIWSTATGELQKTLIASKAELRSVAFAPDGKAIAAGIRYGAVKVWDTSNWQERTVAATHPGDVWGLAFVSDSQLLVTADGDWNRPGLIHITRVTDGAPIAQLRHTGEVLSVAVDRQGKILAAGGGDASVSIWQVPAWLEE